MSFFAPLPSQPTAWPDRFPSVFDSNFVFRFYQVLPASRLENDFR